MKQVLSCSNSKQRDVHITSHLPGSNDRESKNWVGTETAFISAIRRMEASSNGSTENVPEAIRALPIPRMFQSHVRISVNYCNICVSRHL